MPIEVKCEGCGRTLRGHDTLAGKRVKCPNCAAVVELPSLTVEESPKKPSEEQAPDKTPVDDVPRQKAEWYMQTDDGDEYGPVTKDELDQWVKDGRVDKSCQLLQEGWEQWKWAEHIYPELAESDQSEAATVEMFAGIADSVARAVVEDEEINPFESPRESTGTAAAVEDASADASAVSAGARQALAETRPWVTFVAILGFAIGVLWALVPIVILLMSMMVFSIGGIVGSLVAMVGPALYLYATYLLFSYGRAIRAFLGSNRDQDLENALEAQKSFWKLVGIVTAVVLGLYVLLGLIALLLGVAA